MHAGSEESVINKSALGRTLALGAITGMRATAGAATLAYEHGGAVSNVVGLLAAGEFIADKTPFVGNRIDPGPLAARALLGGVVGAAVAYEERDNLLLGGLIGAATAVAVAHLAFHARRRLPLANPLAGALEDAVVFGLAAGAARLR
jgi:uncharacterized membrane protein